VTQRTVGRRALFVGAGGIGVLAVLGGTGYALVDHGVLPGKGELDQLTGGCDASDAGITYGPPGSAVSGSFRSRARGTTVGWTISYPPGHGTRADLPLVLALHGYGGNHTRPLGPRPCADLLGARIDGTPLPPMAIAAADGGSGYWHAHPGDDPMAMLVEEFLPMCRRRGLGHGPVGVTGTSMGGYGALLLAEEHPGLVAAVAAVSPAVWTSYDEAHAANPGAYLGPADFAAHDVVSHAAALAGIPVRVASGADDPFHGDVERLVAALPAGATTVFPTGCHDADFFSAQAPPSLAFVGARLGARR
jgi:pimeloyl-ACP methyl ester carboxylesterase